MLAWYHPPSQLLWLSAEGDVNDDKPSPLLGLEEPHVAQCPAFTQG